MDRKAFLSSLGAGLTFVCAGGCLAGCSKESGGAPGGGGPTPPPPPAGNFTVDLGTEITSVGAAVVKNGVIVVRLDTGNADTSFTAVQVACTHQGTSINFNASERRFVCPNHGSQFATNGTVLTGPATASLKKYRVSVSGNTLTVTS